MANQPRLPYAPPFRLDRIRCVPAVLFRPIEFRTAIRGQRGSPFASSARALSSREDLPAYGQTLLHGRGHDPFPCTCGRCRKPCSCPCEPLCLCGFPSRGQASGRPGGSGTAALPHPRTKRGICRLYSPSDDLRKRKLRNHVLYAFHAQYRQCLVLPPVGLRLGLREALRIQEPQPRCVIRLRRFVPSRRGLSHDGRPVHGGFQGTA